MHLEPLIMNMYASKNRLEELEAANVFDCIECGSCSYICPGRCTWCTISVPANRRSTISAPLPRLPLKLPKRQKPSNRRC
ncbi:hypothetical protein [Intestinimonas butyriciproducens]|uniref:hypothetical protein n=1 Tax=Intestinimonas butyriciproducens TaxID=1297617 RepID=UPI003993901C